MKNKKIVRSFFVLLAVVMCFASFSVTAYAQGDDNDTPTDDSNVKVENPDPQPLTPEGNMTLVDDISGDAAGDKQFIVVQSKGGNYFYIVIDNAADGNNTVHFLNQVDEADLLAIIEDGSATTPAPAVCSCTDKCEAGKVNTACPVCATNMTACSGKAAEPEPEAPTEQPKEKSGMGGLVLLLVVALIGGGGAFYYFKIMKPKQTVKGSTDLDDFDFDEYGEDEPEEREDEEE
ncbi:DUF4366 domain-containing protein [Clostridioides difficile]|nr:DUF4366 domain-containing protein [Clostridioides difficile]